MRKYHEHNHEITTRKLKSKILKEIDDSTYNRNVFENSGYHPKGIGRRIFLKIMGILFFMGGINSWIRGISSNFNLNGSNMSSTAYAWQGDNERLGVDRDGLSSVYLVRDDPDSKEGSKKAESRAKSTVEKRVSKIIEKMGGISKFVGPSDIVVIKPNAQRYNQGMTNTDAIKAFVDLVISISDFNGEIIIAENHQSEEDNSRGWNTENRNGKFNLNELVEFYHSKGFKNITKYHWHNGGPCKYPLEGNAQGDKRVYGPEQGDGYVWMKDCYYTSPNGRKCWMTYPIFTSTYSGITIDLKNGPWKDGKYLERAVKFINFSALNYHSRYAGVTASVKNLMGVVDMTCGFPGDLPADTFNVHHIGVSKLKHVLYYSLGLRGYRGYLRYKFINYCYKNFKYTGGALGYFMQHVRFPDLNIIAAELIGWGDRKDLKKSFNAKAILASTDPVALDYIAAKKILYPSTPSNEREESGKKYKELNNPDHPKSPFKEFLTETWKENVGNIDSKMIRVVEC